MEKETQMYKLVVLTISVGLLTALGSADVYGDSGSDYWPTWRGPDATGVAPKGNPPLTWSETKNIKSYREHLVDTGFAIAGILFALISAIRLLVIASP